MGEPLLRDGGLWVDAELARVHQAHSQYVSEFAGHNTFLFFRAESAVLALPGRREVCLGELANFLGEFEKSPLGGSGDPVNLRVPLTEFLDTDGNVVEVHTDDATRGPDQGLSGSCPQADGAQSGQREIHRLGTTIAPDDMKTGALVEAPRSVAVFDAEADARDPTTPRLGNELLQQGTANALPA